MGPREPALDPSCKLPARPRPATSRVATVRAPCRQAGRARGHIQRARRARAERRGEQYLAQAAAPVRRRTCTLVSPGDGTGRAAGCGRRALGNAIRGARGAPRAVRRGEALPLHQPATCQRVRAGPGAGDRRVREGGPPSAAAVSPTERRPTAPESESASFGHPPGGSCALHTRPLSNATFKLCSCCAQRRREHACQGLYLGRVVTGRPDQSCHCPARPKHWHSGRDAVAQPGQGRRFRFGDTALEPSRSRLQALRCPAAVGGSGPPARLGAANLS